MYNFKIKQIITNNGTAIIPKSINIIIGPNNSGKSQFLKDIKNSLSSHNYLNKKNITIRDMEYILPKNKEEFISRYNLHSKIFSNSDNQYYIRNYSGIYDNNIIVSNPASNYLDTGNISITPNWEIDLQRQITNFDHFICNDEKIIEGENYPQNAIIHNEKYIEIEENGKKVRKTIAGSEGPLYEEKGASIKNFINLYGNLFF